MLDTCDHCGRSLYTKRCKACRLTLCDGHRVCPECDSDDNLVLYEDTDRPLPQGAEVQRDLEAGVEPGQVKTWAMT